MKEVIWVMGPSAVGKETKKKTIAGDLKALKLLNMESESIVSCGASYHFNGNYKDDPIDKAREKIFDEIPDLLKNYDVVLIKWQHIDSELNRPERLKELLPEATHRAVLLVTPRHELAERLPIKSWWHDYGKELAHVNRGIEHVAKSLDTLPISMTLTIILSSDKKFYSIINGNTDVESLYT